MSDRPSGYSGQMSECPIVLLADGPLRGPDGQPLFSPAIPAPIPTTSTALTTPRVAHRRTSCSACAALIRSWKPYPFPILSFFLELRLS